MRHIKLKSQETKKSGILFCKAFQTVKAGDERIELPLRVLETPVMPFDQSPVSNVLNIYIMKRGGMSSIILKISEI